MTDSGNQSSSEPNGSEKKKQSNNGKKELRILMLHGYTQSGTLFRAKTRALEKLLAKALAPLNLVPTLIYPTGPNRLSVRDVPGYEPVEGADKDDEAETDSWAWYRKDEATGAYRFLNEGMQRLADVIKESSSQSTPEQADSALPPTGWGGIDGVVGFSQGGSMAAMLAAAMEAVPGSGEDNRRPVPDASSSATPGSYNWEWVRAVREANRGVPLRFAVIYSGFFAPPAELAWLYEPKISTPTLHYIGSLDTVVDESRSQGLVERSKDPVVAVHPGGHYVPVSKEWVMPLVGFIRQCVG